MDTSTGLPTFLPPGRRQWAHQDSNLGPTGYEPAALTSLSYGPPDPIQHHMVPRSSCAHPGLRNLRSVHLTTSRLTLLSAHPCAASLAASNHEIKAGTIRSAQGSGASTRHALRAAAFDTPPHHPRQGATGR